MTEVKYVFVNKALFLINQTTLYEDNGGPFSEPFLVAERPPTITIHLLKQNISGVCLGGSVEHVRDELIEASTVAVRCYAILFQPFR